MNKWEVTSIVLRKDSSGKHGHKGHWLLLSVKTGRVLRIYGVTKPSPATVKKDEDRIEMFRHMKRRR